MISYVDIIDELNELAEWADANIYEVPINLPDTLRTAAIAIGRLNAMFVESEVKAVNQAWRKEDAN